MGDEIKSFQKRVKKNECIIFMRSNSLQQSIVSKNENKQKRNARPRAATEFS